MYGEQTMQNGQIRMRNRISRITCVRIRIVRGVANTGSHPVGRNPWNQLAMTLTAHRPRVSHESNNHRNIRKACSRLALIEMTAVSGHVGGTEREIGHLGIRYLHTRTTRQKNFHDQRTKHRNLHPKRRTGMKSPGAGRMRGRDTPQT